MFNFSKKTVCFQKIQQKQKWPGSAESSKSEMKKVMAWSLLMKNWFLSFISELFTI